ncbi:MAG: hypothetical protein HC934_00915 [Acaryochloridaceae cyanobacterium SU_2_1]|nr:hypothetical protein [Acaryochloridaceae cyanobacterium SU_2_1]
MLLPFWQAVKAVLYYDLCSRNEGLTFDLESVTLNPLNYLRRVILQTPESIEIDLALAGIGSRALAWVVDQILLAIALSFFWFFGAVLYLYVILPLATVAFNGLNIERLNQWTFCDLIPFAICALQRLLHCL